MIFTYSHLYNHEQKICVIRSIASPQNKQIRNIALSLSKGDFLLVCSLFFKIKRNKSILYKLQKYNY